jgi:hypothetical protein
LQFSRFKIFVCAELLNRYRVVDVPQTDAFGAVWGHGGRYNTLQYAGLQTGLAGRSMDGAVFRYLYRCSGDEKGQSIRVGRKCGDQFRVTSLQLGAR